MSNISDKLHFKNKKEMGYMHIMDDKFYSVGIFLLPNGVDMPPHNHKNMMVFSKIIVGQAELESFDKISSEDKNNDEFEIYVDIWESCQ